MNISKELASLNRHEIRYILHRFRNGKQEDNKLYNEIEKYISSQPDFTRWEEFTEAWDVATDNPLRVIKRRFTMEEEWDSIVRQHVRIIR